MNIFNYKKILGYLGIGLYILMSAFAGGVALTPNEVTAGTHLTGPQPDEGITTTPLEECEITSAEFVNFYGTRNANFYTEENRPVIKIKVEATNGCGGEDFIVTPYENSGVFTGGVSHFDSNPYTMPANGVLEIDLLAGENECEIISGATGNHCQYHIRVYEGTSINENDLVYSTEDDGGKGELIYDCDTTCDDDWGEPRLSDGWQTVCRVQSAQFQPAGDQGDSWYSEKTRPTAIVTIETENCDGKEIEVSITSYLNWSIDRDINDMDNRKFQIKENERLELIFKTGNENCADLHRDCTYIIRVWDESVTGLGLYPYSSKDNINGTLQFQCPDCGDGIVGGAFAGNRWDLLKYSTDKEVGAVTITGQTPTYERGQPCVDDDTLELRDNCYAVLAPLSPDLTEVDADFTLGKYVNIIVQIIIGIAGVLAVVMIVFGGVQYMTTDAYTGKSTAKDTILNAVMGLLIALGSFVILNTINPNLLNIDGESLSEVHLEIDGPADLLSDETYDVSDPKVQNVKRGTEWGGGNPPAGPPPGYQFVKLRDQLPAPTPPLTNGPISVNNPECAFVGISGCTSTFFTQAAAAKIIDKLTALQTACACNIVITGGSEFWLHRTHGPSYAILDFSTKHDNYPQLSANDVAKLNEALTGSPNYPTEAKNFTNFPGIEAYAHQDEPIHWHIKIQ